MRRRVRRSTEAWVSRLFDLISELHLGGCPTRQELAVRWRCTPRAVSHLLATARERFGVRIEADGSLAARGYQLVDSGVFDAAAVARRVA